MDPGRDPRAVNRRDFLQSTALAGVWAATSGFASLGLKSYGGSYPYYSDALGELLDGMDPGTWMRLDDKVSQPTGIVGAAQPQTTAEFAIPGWEADWDGYPDPSMFNQDGWTDGPDSVIKSWNSASVVDKPGHVKIYVCGAGGHANYGGNETYAFDLLAAAASKNGGGDGGTWERPLVTATGLPNVSARLSLISARGRNTDYPYDNNMLDAAFTHAIYNPEYNPTSNITNDHRHAGPPSTHVYGGHVYDVDLDAIVVYGGAHFQLGNRSGAGFWLWSIVNQRWELLESDYDRGPGVQAEDGAFSLEDATGISSVDWTLIRYDVKKYAFMKANVCFRVRLDGNSFTPNLGGVNTMAQTAGVFISNHGGEKPPGGSYAIGAKWNPAESDGGDKESSNPAGFIFYEDTNTGDGDGTAIIWTDLDQEGTAPDNAIAAYADPVPNDGTNQQPDLSSGVYSLEHDKFFFPHKVNLADCNGQIYAFDRPTQEWTTYINPVSGPPPAASGGAQGLRGWFSYLPARNCFILGYEADTDAGHIWVCKGL